MNFIINITKEIFYWVFYIAIAVIIAASLNIFVFQMTSVSGSSMMNTLHNNDLYLTSKIQHTLRMYPKYEDIVVIDSRVSETRTFLTEITDIYHHNAITTLLRGSQPRDYWVKRVIGLPGDTLLLSEGVVYRNGIALAEDYVNPDEPPIYNGDEYIVPEGHVFVLGDNRNHSSDSRLIGAVPVENVIGVVTFKIKSGS